MYFINSDRFRDPPIEAIRKTEECFWYSLAQEVFDQAGIRAFATGLKNPFHNPVVASKFQLQSLDSLVEIDRFFQERDLPWSWGIHLSDLSPGAQARLEAFGLIAMDHSPVMIYENGVGNPTVLMDVDVRAVDGPGMFGDWALALREGFESTESDIKAYLNLHQQASSKGYAEFRQYVAYLGEIPVAGATLSLSSYGARLDDVATRTDYQRRGFGTAVTLYALMEACQAGYPWCCLDSSDDGLQLYEKIGFKILGQKRIFGRKARE